MEEYICDYSLEEQETGKATRMQAESVAKRNGI